MEALREYLWAVFWTKWAGMFALLVGIDEFLEWTVPRYRVRLNQMFSQGTRRKIFLVAFLIFIFVAGFLAWDDKRVERLDEPDKYLAFEEVSKGELREAHEKITKLEAQPRIGEEVKAQIADLTQTKQQLQQKVETLERQLSPWELTENQKRQLVAALKRYKVPLGTTYQVKIFTPDMCEKCAGYAIDLVEAWYEIPGWEIGKDVSYALDVRLQGVEVPVDMEGCSPEGLFLVMKALEAAEIKYKKVLTEGKVRLGLCSIFVGNRSQE